MVVMVRLVSAAMWALQVLPAPLVRRGSVVSVALANVAELEARHAVERMFGLEPTPIRYEALSAIMFLSPEVASVGLNEQQAREQQAHAALAAARAAYSEIESEYEAAVAADP